jgi:hypothetical protein
VEDAGRRTYLKKILIFENQILSMNNQQQQQLQLQQQQFQAQSAQQFQTQSTAYQDEEKVLIIKY